jgi:hypothetical protein
MKTKGLIYILSLIFVLLSTSCEEDHIMTKYTGDAASFLKESYVISIKPDFEYLEIPVFHKSINQSGSKLEIEVVASEGTASDIFSIDKTVFDFNEADTLITKLSIDYTKLTEFTDYSVTLNFTDTYLDVAYDGYESVTISFAKYSRIYEWVGNYTVDAVSNYDPGNWDESWSVTTKATDPTHLEIIGIAGSEIPINATLNTDPGIMTITIPYGQDIGDVYDNGATLIYNSNEALEKLESDLIGTINEDGSFSFDYMMLYFPPPEDWDWDIFTPMFNKD